MPAQPQHHQPAPQTVMQPCSLSLAVSAARYDWFESADVCLCCLQWVVQPSQAEEADEQMRLKAHGVSVWHLC